MSRNTDLATKIIWLALFVLSGWATTTRSADQWAVSQYRTNDDRPLYACDLDCIADQNRGPNIGRVNNGTLCEGQLDPVWASSGGRQWQFVTNATGERGVAVCSLQQIVEPPPPSNCETGFIAMCVAECEWVSGIPATDPACIEPPPPPEPCALDSSLNADDPLCVPCVFDSTIIATNPACPAPCDFNPSIPENDPLCVDPGTGLQISNLGIDNRQPPVLDPLSAGAVVFADRSYTYTRVDSPFDTYQAIKTYNDDKRASPDRAYVSFDVTAPVDVYLVRDQGGDAPAWLSAWQLITPAPIAVSWTTAQVWKNTFAAGTVEIPGQGVGNSNYSVVIGAEAPPPVCPFDGTILADDPACPSPCALDSSIPDTSPLCIPCQWNPAILAGDSNCIEPPATGSATLSWTAPTLNADNTPLDDLSGYKVYFDKQTGDCKQFTNVDTINDETVTTYFRSGIDVGVTYFGVTAFDTSGNESDCSNIASKDITED